MNITNMSVQLKRKMNFFIVILGIWLLPKAEALKCYECSTSDPEGCTDQEVECASENHQCASVFLKGGSPIEKIQIKGCVLPEECNEYSAIYGEEKRLRISKCCNSDLCNTEPVPEPSEPVPNGLQCFGCVGDDCDRTVNCEGIEDHCFTETVSFSIITRTRKGCASKSVCSALESDSEEESFGIKRSCCQGNFCNAAPTDTLKCYKCSTPGNCTDKKEEVQCPDQNHQCASVYIKDKYTTTDLQLTGCVPAEQCGDFSTDYGDNKKFKMIQCCNSDLCNGQLIEPESVPNGKTCCLGEQCDRTLNCEGNMDHCFTTTTVVLALEGIEKGCTTKDHCALKTDFKHKYFAMNVSCCQGNNCNHGNIQPKITPTVKSSTTISNENNRGGIDSTVKSNATISNEINRGEINPTVQSSATISNEINRGEINPTVKSSGTISNEKNQIRGGINPTVKSSAITAAASTSIFAGLLIFLVLLS